MYACLGVTCHLRFWQNDQYLLRATAVTRGWNEHRIRVSTQSWLWSRKFSRRSGRDSNSQPFDHQQTISAPEFNHEYNILLKNINTLFSYLFYFRHQNLYDAVFQRDSARSQTARHITRSLANNNVQTLPWPYSTSLDLNPIEHSWDELDRHVRGRVSASSSSSSIP